MNAFDTLAASYDSDFTAAPIAQYLRHHVHTALHRLVTPGCHVLELGCGTGEDAHYVQSLGAHVTATDTSTAMLEQARHKNASNTVQFAQLDLNALPSEDFQTQYDVVFANFGVVNCVVDMPMLAHWLTPRVKIGGHVLLIVMPPLCLWEILWHLLHLEPRVALRRLRSTTFQPTPYTAPLRIHYPMPGAVMRAFAPDIMPIASQPLGVLLPNSAAYGVVERRPRLLQTLLQYDEHLHHVAWLSGFADHAMLTFRRVS